MVIQLVVKHVDWSWRNNIIWQLVTLINHSLTEEILTALSTWSIVASTISSCVLSDDCVMKDWRTDACWYSPDQPISWILLSSHHEVFFSPMKVVQEFPVCHHKQCSSTREPSLSLFVGSFLGIWYLLKVWRPSLDTKFHVRPDIYLVQCLKFISIQWSKMSVDPAKYWPCFWGLYNTLSTWFRVAGKYYSQISFFCGFF